MPEGPSLVIAREEMKIFQGKKILEATGYSKIDKDLLINKKVTAFKTWGKHLLICLPQVYYTHPLPGVWEISYQRNENYQSRTSF